MSGATPPLPQYAPMVWCSVKALGQLYFYTVKPEMCSPCGQKTRYEGVWGSGREVPLFWTSAVDGDQWSASRSGRFILGETNRETLCPES
jgi:hypothetical protein